LRCGLQKDGAHLLLAVEKAGAATEFLFFPFNAKGAMELTRLAPADEKLLASIAAHEAGHAVVALAFGLRPRAYIGGPDSGICKHEPGVAWQNAAIIWGAVLAEDILRARNALRTVPRCELTPETFLDWMNEFEFEGGMEQLRQYSEPDFLVIAAEAARSRDIARAAFKILDANRDLLKEVADNLVEHSRLRFWKNGKDFDLAESLCLSLQ